MKFTQFSGLACLLLVLAACQPIQYPVDLVPTSFTTQADDGTHRFDIGERKLFLLCEGKGSPTVLLEAGLGSDHTTWTRIQSEAAKSTHVCSYDRAGLGKSDPTATPRTSAEIAVDLHTLLAVVGENGSYVLVGHSFGGLHVRLYASTFADEVIGAVLVDAVYEDWWKRGLALLPAENANENDLLKQLRRYFASEGGEPEENAEGIDISATAAQLRKSGDLGIKPLIVLVAGISDVVPSGLSQELQAPLVNLLQNDLPGKLVKLSLNSIRINVPDSGHDITNMQPDVVIAASKTIVDITQP